MPKEYVYQYAGSKQSFLTTLDQFHTNHNGFYYLDDYIIEVRNDQIRFGIERAGHSGGNWLVSQFAEVNGQIEFRGTVEYIGPENNRTQIQKLGDRVEEILLFILLFPIIVIVWGIRMIIWLIRKLRKLPVPKTIEDKLSDLMEHRLNCQRVIDANKS